MRIVFVAYVPFAPSPPFFILLSSFRIHTLLISAMHSRELKRLMITVRHRPRLEDVSHVFLQFAIEFVRPPASIVPRPFRLPFNPPSHPFDCCILRMFHTCFSKFQLNSFASPASVVPRPFHWPFNPPLPPFDCCILSWCLGRGGIPMP